MPNGRVMSAAIGIASARPSMRRVRLPRPGAARGDGEHDSGWRRSGFNSSQRYHARRGKQFEPDVSAPAGADKRHHQGGDEPERDRDAQ